MQSLYMCLSSFQQQYACHRVAQDFDYSYVYLKALNLRYHFLISISDLECTNDTIVFFFVLWAICKVAHLGYQKVQNNFRPN